jgi:hypothetical protein
MSTSTEPPPRFSLRSLFIVTTIAVIPLALLVQCNEAWDFEINESLDDPAKWHIVMQNHLEHAKSDGVSLQSVAAYKLDFDYELWKWEASAEVLQWMIDRLQLSPVAANDPDIQKLHEVLPAAWYGGSLSQNCDYFSSVHSPFNPDADAYFVAVDKDRGWILVWFYFDF